jgi:hypothetical protein
VYAKDPFGTPTPTVNWPVWTPGVVNGLPGLDWGTWGGTPTTVRYLQRAEAPGSNLPLPPGTPRMYFALIKPNSPVGGILCTFRLTADDLELALWATGGQQVLGMDHATNFWDRGTDAAHPVVGNYTNTPVVVGYIFNGPTAAKRFFVNGVEQATFNFPSPPGIFGADGGNPGFSLGYNAASAYAGPAYSGIKIEEFAYSGVDMTVATLAMRYLKARGGL